MSVKPSSIEKDLQKSITSALRLYGWLVQRNHQQGIGMTRGRPDLEAYKKGVTLFVECKSPQGKLSNYQLDYIRNLREYEMNVLVADDLNEFLDELEGLEEDLWHRGVRRLI